MNTLNKRGWIFGGAAALIMIGTIAQLTNSRAQNAAPAPAPANAIASTNLAPAELPKLPADLSPGLSDVIKLVQSNVGDDVVIGYIKNSNSTYQPTADEIVYLNDLGVSQNVINALMQNGNASLPPNAATPPTQPQQFQPPPASTTLNSPEAPTYPDQSVEDTTPPPDVPAQTAGVDQTPPPDVTVNYFYDSLAPYGSWVDVDGYGRCWRPSVAVVNGGWRPYSDNGYWVYTDAGWYWRSYYSWGWAAFHYGRWCSTPRFGWVWSPDCTWGPAWVAWREHDRYCGWAPLPPHAVWRPGAGIVWTGGHGHGHVDWGFGLSVGAFTFVSYDHFTDHHPWRYQPSRTEVVNIYNHSTIIKNTVVVHNKTIINNGISRDKIVNVTHKPVQTVALRDSNTATHGHLERVGNKPTLAVYRPTPTTIAKAAKTPSVRNKPVFINNAPRTTSFGSASHSAYSASGRTQANTSSRANNHNSLTTPRSTPMARSSSPRATSTTPEVHQSWPGANSTPHTSPAATEKIATANSRPSSSETPRFEPSVHSTAPSKTVEQPNNYYGSGGYHHSSAAPSTSSHAAPGSSAGRANFGGASAGGHAFGGASHAERPEAGGRNR